MTLPLTRPHPEWKQLLSAIKPFLESKNEFSYDELAELAGVDVRTSRGRGQFYKFRKHALVEWNMWFEVEKGKGYRRIPAGEHPAAAVKRVKWAGRKVRMAKAINALAPIQDMTSEQRLTHAQAAALLDDLSQVFRTTSRQLAAIGSKLRLELSDEDLRLMSEEPPARKVPQIAN
jgi:hypothetical protein